MFHEIFQGKKISRNFTSLVKNHRSVGSLNGTINIMT